MDENKYEKKIKLLKNIIESKGVQYDLYFLNVWKTLQLSRAIPGNHAAAIEVGVIIIDLLLPNSMLL